MRGVPLRLEVGPKDLAKGNVALARRDRPGKEGRSFVSQDGLELRVGELLEEIQRELFRRALAFREQNTHRPEDYDDFRQVVEGGWADVWWCGEADCEAAIKDDTKAASRVIPLDQPEAKASAFAAVGRPGSGPSSPALTSSGASSPEVPSFREAHSLCLLSTPPG
jgi:prolyl-tRNA synthetase